MSKNFERDARYLEEYIQATGRKDLQVFADLARVMAGGIKKLNGPEELGSENLYTEENPTQPLFESFTTEELSALTTPECPQNIKNKMTRMVVKTLATLPTEKYSPERTFSTELAIHYRYALGGRLPDGVRLRYLTIPSQPEMNKLIQSTDQPEQDELIDNSIKLPARLKQSYSTMMYSLIRHPGFNAVGSIRKASFSELKIVRNVGQKYAQLLSILFEPIK